MVAFGANSCIIQHGIRASIGYTAVPIGNRRWVSFFGEIMTDIQMTTLQELVKLALPIETRALVDHGLLDRPVTWVVSVSAPELTRLDAGDFVFLLPPYPSDLAMQFARLAQMGALAGHRG